jgi:hypothetical protein
MINIQREFRRRNPLPELRPETKRQVNREQRLPMWNEAMPAVAEGLKTQPSDYVDLDYWIKNTPEAIGILNALVTDIMSGGIRFYGEEARVKKAKKFYDDTFFRTELKNAIFDWAIYGDAYLWISSLTDEQIQRAIAKLVEKNSELKKIEIKTASGKTIEAASVDTKKLQELLEVPDEDKLKAVKYVPTTTMSILHEKYQITGYRQVVGHLSQEFKRDEIIHAKFLTVEGKIYGFSPMRACLPEMQNIGYIKDYNKNYYKNGAVPEHIFMLEDAAGDNDPNLEAMRQHLQKYRNPLTNRGNMVMGGSWKVQQLEGKEGMSPNSWALAIYNTGVIAAAYGMPVERIMQVSGRYIRTGTGAADVANESWWRIIDVYQEYWKTLLNNQFWKPYFKVEMHFSKAFKQDEFREAQRDLMKSDTLFNIRNRLKIPISDKFIIERLGIEEKDLDPELKEKLKKEEPDKEVPEDMPMSTFRQLQQSTDRVIPGQAAQRQRELRRADAARAMQ